MNEPTHPQDNIDPTLRRGAELRRNHRRFINVFEDPLLHQAFRVLDSMQDRGIDVEKLLSGTQPVSDRGEDHRRRRKKL